MKSKHKIFVRWLEAHESPFKAIRQKQSSEKQRKRHKDLNETEVKIEENILQCS